MTKPVIISRTVKAAPLDYAELDTNFENLRNATIGVAGDSGSAQALDLNDTVNILGGVGLTSVVTTDTVTVNLDNTAVTPGSYTNVNLTVDAQGRITAAATGQGGSATNSFGEISVGGVNIFANQPAATLLLTAGGGINLAGNAATKQVTITSNTMNSDAKMLLNLDLNGFVVFSGFSRTVGGVTFPSGTVHVIGNLDVSGNVELAKITVATNDIFGGTSIAGSSVGGRIFVGDRVGTGGADTQLILASANGAGTVEIQGALKVSDPTGEPNDQVNIVDWLKITVGTTVRFLPLYS